MARGKRGGDPDKPKRPMSAYFLWFSENRKSLMKRHPNLHVCDLAKKAGKEWAGVKDKSKWEKRAKAEMAKYQVKMAAYKEKNADDKPKRPQGAFFIFLNKNRDQLKKRYPGFNVCQLTTKAGLEWNALEDKSEWEELAKEAAAEYQKQMADYNQANPEAPDCSGGCSTKRRRRRKSGASPTAGGKRRRRRSSTAGDKRRRRRSSTAGDKRRRRRSTSSGDKRRRRRSSSAGDKRRRRRSSSAGDKRRRRRSTAVGGKRRRKRSTVAGSKRRICRKPAASKRRCCTKKAPAGKRRRRRSGAGKRR